MHYNYTICFSKFSKIIFQSWYYYDKFILFIKFSTNINSRKFISKCEFICKRYNFQVIFKLIQIKQWIFFDHYINYKFKLMRNNIFIQCSNHFEIIFYRMMNYICLSHYLQLWFDQIDFKSNDALFHFQTKFFRIMRFVWLHSYSCKSIKREFNFFMFIHIYKFMI